jgi:putative spermidine/putrescine transport system permease protein
MLRFSRLSKAAMLAIIALILTFMYVPLFILILNSLNEAQVSSWPIESYSLKWWETAVELEAIRNALLNSVLVAFGAMVVASILGTLAAFALSRFSFFGKSTVNLLIVLPIALPGVVTGVAFSNTYSNFLTPAGFQIGYFGMIVAHATFCIVMVFNNVIARLRRMNPNLQEASMDLGQGVWGTFRLVTFPQFRAAFGAGALLAFALSFDEVVVTIFTAPPGVDTIPLWILKEMARPTQASVVNVVATVIIVLSLIPVYVSQRLSRSTEDSK